MTRILAFLAMVVLFFLLEGGFFIQNSALSLYNFLFLKQSEKPQIIFGGGYIFSDVFYINKGSEDGFKKGDLVVYNSSVAIGKLDEIFPKNSKVVPFSKFGAKTSLRVGERKSILFEGVGNGGGRISADFPNSLAITAGDGVYLAEYPNYLAGVVDSVDKKEGRDFQKVSIRIPVSLKSVMDADIIKNDATE